MIPDALREFFSAPRWCGLAMVDERGRPHLARCLGWLRGPPGGPDLVLVVRTDFVKVLPGRGASERIAVVMNEAERFVAYQLKGRGRTREVTEEEVSAARTMLDTLAVVTEKSWGLPASLYTSIPISPAIAVEMMVEEAFAQSPGPGAGRPIGGAP